MRRGKADGHEQVFTLADFRDKRTKRDRVGGEPADLGVAFIFRVAILHDALAVLRVHGVGGQPRWIGRDDAIKLIRSSRWARLKEPAANIFEQIGRGLSGARSDYDRDLLLFEHHIEMTLESFVRNHPHGFREVGDKKEYAETQLRSFIDSALDTEAIKKFGDVPT